MNTWVEANIESQRETRLRAGAPSLASATRARECLLLSQAPPRESGRSFLAHPPLPFSPFSMLVGLSRPRSLETPVGLMTRRPQPARSTSESETPVRTRAPPASALHVMDPRENMRHVGGGWSTPQREILRWGWGGLDPPARDLALGGGRWGDPPARARGSAPRDRARWALAWFSDTEPKRAWG